MKGEPYNLDDPADAARFDEDLYEEAARRLGCSREEAKRKLLEHVFGFRTLTAEPDMVGDVTAFFDKFAVPRAASPAWPPEDVVRFRFGHIWEELDELHLGWETKDMAMVADAIADLIYLLVGTALTFGVPLREVWREVQAANMRKVRCTGADDPRTKRGHGYDVVKPADWVGPDVEGVIARARAAAEVE